MRRLEVIGNLTKDAEPKNMNGSNAIVFTIAVNDKYKDKNGVKHDKAFYYDCTIWRDDAESLVGYFKKGTKMFISGSPEINQWVNKDGEHKASIRIRVNLWEFHSTGNTTENNTNQNQGSSDNDDMPF